MTLPRMRPRSERNPEMATAREPTSRPIHLWTAAPLQGKSRRLAARSLAVIYPVSVDPDGFRKKTPNHMTLLTGAMYPTGFILSRSATDLSLHLVHLHNSLTRRPACQAAWARAWSWVVSSVSNAQVLRAVLFAIATVATFTGRLAMSLFTNHPRAWRSRRAVPCRGFIAAAGPGPARLQTDVPT